MKKKEIEQILNTYYTDKSLNKSVASELFDLYVVSHQRGLLIAYEIDCAEPYPYDIEKIQAKVDKQLRN